MVATSKRPDDLPKANAALWDWIEKQGLSQRAAAKVFRVPFVTLNHYLHNRRRPRLARLNRIYEITGIPVTLWLDTRVGTPKRRHAATSRKHQYLPTGNANVG